MKILISGGSIAGLAAAALLKQHEVIVYEQHSEKLKHQGAGITLPQELITALIDRCILNPETLVKINKRRIIRTGAQQEMVTICEQSFTACSLHWQTLYTTFKSHIADEKIKLSCRVTGLEGTTLHYVQQGKFRSESGDLILGADGHHSFIAKTLDPEIKQIYSGFVAWRGTVAASGFTTVLQQQIIEIFGSPKDSQAAYFVYPFGHCIMYLIREPEKGQVLINWVLYEKRDETSLKNVLPFNPVDQCYQTIARGHMQANEKNYLHHFIQCMPHIAQMIILHTEEPFIQPVYAMRPNCKTNPQGTIALLGDASGTLPPQAGSGAAKGLTQALQIAAALEQEKNLIKWGAERMTIDNNLYPLAERMQDFWVLNTPDWQNMTSTDFEGYWQKVMLGQDWYTSDTMRSKL